MPQSFTCLNYHIVFSTRDRSPLITPDYRQRLYEYLGGILKHEKGTLLGAGGMSDHVHLLAEIDKERSLSQMLQILKSHSSRWVHETFPAMRHFAWQAGYGAFTISRPGIPRVQKYLAEQETHHRLVSFQEEFISFLDEQQIPYDPRYLFE